MPSATTKGFPYPLGSDDLADTDIRIKALADFLEANVGVFKSGQAVSASLAAGASGDITVNFTGVAFGATPNVVASVQINGSDPSLFSVMVKTISATQVVFRVKNGSGSAVAIPVQWIARG